MARADLGDAAREQLGEVGAVDAIGARARLGTGRCEHLVDRSIEAVEVLAHSRQELAAPLRGRVVSAQRVCKES